MENILNKTELNELLEAPVNRLTAGAKAGNNIVIGYTCRYVPEALLSVKGLVPVFLKPISYVNTSVADGYLSSVNCSYCRCLLETALDFQFEDIDGYVFTASCDHLRRVYDNLSYSFKPRFIEILDLPHKCEKEHIEWYADELKSLAQKLESEFSIEMSEEAIVNSISQYNDFQILLQKLSDLRKSTVPKISGTDFHRLYLLSLTSPKTSLKPTVEHFIQQAENAPNTTKTARPRIMLLGSRLEDNGFISKIESLGSHVVADRFCGGSLPGLNIIQTKDNESVFTSLARHSFENTNCPRMMDEFNARISFIKQVITDYKVDAVIMETMKFCDIWGVESVALVHALKELEIPLLKLEREYSTSGSGQLETRVQAFLESIDK